MEHFDPFRPHPERGGMDFRAHSGLIPGLVLVAIGALVFLNNLHIFYIREWLRFWPAILIAAGIVKLVDSTYGSGRAVGAGLTAFGCLLLARTLGYLELGMRELWPLFLIGLGLMLLLQRTGDWSVRSPGPPPISGAPQTPFPTSSGVVHIDTIFGGVKRIVRTDDFQGGHITAMFGGVEIDLRQAEMLGDSATLEVNAIFGGVEVRIPRTWSAVVHGSSIFGGYADETVQPDPGPGVKQLIFRGSATFGGVEIKN